MIKAVIIDDEADCCEVLALLLAKYCPQVEVAGICLSAEEGLRFLSQNKVQIVFLDIEMPHMNGFDLLRRLPSVDFDLVFTTSYDQYAIRAIKFSALDYLLKPIDREELQAAVKKVEAHLRPAIPQQLELLLQKLQQPAHAIRQIALPTMEGLQLLPIESIISCTSSSNYTILHLHGAPNLVVSRTLKEIEAMLEDHSFLRVHHSHLVNLKEVRKYLRGEGGMLVMSDGSSVDVSRSRKEMLLKKLQG